MYHLPPPSFLLPLSLSIQRQQASLVSILLWDGEIIIGKYPGCLTASPDRGPMLGLWRGRWPGPANGGAVWEQYKLPGWGVKTGRVGCLVFIIVRTENITKTLWKHHNIKTGIKGYPRPHRVRTVYVVGINENFPIKKEEAPTLTIRL